eukprot:Phypoly_transcript_04617.p1 GENE.Phypoly_transcript_04617~~Phypoly_transcript_04617.p1  ORF type:complete len:675 (+),score=122.80 Phypoly_transcript_04617:83-2107(+)
MARVIYWFRTDLRIHDSPALKAALDLKSECFYPIWTWDPHYVYRARVGPNRWKFLLECQADLSKQLTKLNHKQKLLVIRESPTTLFPKLFKEWKITHLFFEKDTDAYAAERDAKVISDAKKAGVNVVVTLGRTLWDPEEIVKKNGGPTMSYTQLVHATDKIGKAPPPVPAPTHLPDPGDIRLSFAQYQERKGSKDLNALHRTEHPDESYQDLRGPNGDFSVPTLAELGISDSAATSPHRGGESVALASLQKILEDSEYVATFSKPDTAPTAFQPAATTLLSPHLHFGSLGIRQFLHGVLDATNAYKGKKSAPPTNLPGQLYFREMYFSAQHASGHLFAQTINNAHCRFIPWHLPSIVQSDGQRLTTGRYFVDSEEADVWFRKWTWGMTGFPFVDALMRQLRQEGWIHHLGRHMVACFLTRGGCYVDWERGAEVFEELLIDHEVSCNVGNWQWLSCSAFFTQFLRVYSPVAFGKKWDPDGTFVRKYVPELKNFDKKYIYEPHLAPVADQRKWKCVIEDLPLDILPPSPNAGEKFTPSPPQKPVFSDKDGMKRYPAPMFDFGERRAICLDKMKDAYHVGLFGNDPKVLDGTALGLFAGDKVTEKRKLDDGKKNVDQGEPATSQGGDQNLMEAPVQKRRKTETERGEEGKKSVKKTSKGKKGEGKKKKETNKKGYFL